MPELVVGSLALRVTDAGAQSHRIEGITLRALELLGARIDELGGPQRRSAAATGEAPVIDLANQTDDEAAAVVAGAWLDALALRLEG